MGLLDEAIREHLELKRLRGADLSEVIREEREALGQGEAGFAEAVAGSGARPSAREGRAFDVAAQTGLDLSGLSQETAELDMRTVLGPESCDGDGRAESDAPPSAMAAAPSPARAQPSASRGATWSDSLEWVPSDRGNLFDERFREEDRAGLGL